jgi:hypothetical protein
VNHLGRRLTDDDNIGVNGQQTTPEDGTETSPLGVLGTWRAGQELVQQPENKHTNDLGYNANGNCKTLKDEVGDVEVGRGWQRATQNGEDLARVLGNLHNCSRGSISDGPNKEYLDHLKAKV